MVLMPLPNTHWPVELKHTKKAIQHVIYKRSCWGDETEAQIIVGSSRSRQSECWSQSPLVEVASEVLTLKRRRTHRVVLYALPWNVYTQTKEMGASLRGSSLYFLLAYFFNFSRVCVHYCSIMNLCPPFPPNLDFIWILIDKQKSGEVEVGSGTRKMALETSVTGKGMPTECRLSPHTYIHKSAASLYFFLVGGEASGGRCVYLGCCSCRESACGAQIPIQCLWKHQKLRSMPIWWPMWG